MGWRHLIAGAVFLAAFAGVGRASAEPGFVGMQVQGISPEIAATLGLAAAKGVLIRDVALGGPAAEAGFERGDLIVGFAGAPVDTLEQLVAEVGRHTAGDTVAARVHRRGETRELQFTLGAWPSAWQVDKGAFANLPQRGVTLTALTPKVRDAFRLRWGSVGVVVSLVDIRAQGVTPLERGDLIVQVNQETVWQPARVVDLYREAKDTGKQSLLLLVERASGFYFVMLPVG